YVLGQIWPDTFSATVPSPPFMFGFCALMAFGVAYICFRGVSGTTAVNSAINVIQISALVVFSVIAIGYRLNHPQGSVGITIAPHAFSFVIIQACIAILILVGFESITSMGEEAKNAKRDIPRAVLLSLLIQGLVCYLIEYFAANFFLHNGYQISNALGSAAPVGDMMIIAGTWLFGSAAAGKAFMLVQALTVFLALVGTTLSCMSTGARVTYAMGRD